MTRNRHVPSHPKKDRISELPDHALIAILSQLSLKEAASSHLLSKRWNSLWTYVTCLNFEAVGEIDYSILFEQRLRYMSWVNAILQSHRGTTLDQFGIYFDPDSKSCRDIDNWIDFAIQRRVKKLDVTMINPLFQSNPVYSFPDAFIKTPRGLSCIKSLTSLSLNHVNVTSQQLEHFLSNSPLLERLCVVHSPDLKILRVEGLTLHLKFLELYMCWSLECVKIFAPNLISFKFYGGRLKPRFYIDHAPSLVQVSALSNCRDAVDTFCPALQHFIHLQALTLNLVLKEGTAVPSKSLVFTRLKMLTLIFEVKNTQSLFDWIFMIERAPSLQIFSIQFETHSGLGGEIKSPNFKHECLKTVEFVGFTGVSLDIEVVKYLIEVATVLDLIIIDRRFVSPIGIHPSFQETRKRKKIKAHAMGLKKEIPQGVELVVI